jgi:glucan phosphorylase
VTPAMLGCNQEVPKKARTSGGLSAGAHWLGICIAIRDETDSRVDAVGQRMLLNQERLTKYPALRLKDIEYIINAAWTIVDEELPLGDASNLVAKAMGEITWKTEGNRARTYVENRWNNKTNCKLKKRFMSQLAESLPPLPLS